MSTLASLTIVPATKEQTIESRKRNHCEWSRGVPLDRYLECYDVLENYEHGGPALTTWVLVPRNEPTSLAFFSACETYRRTAIFKTVSGVEEVTAYAIASVYTPSRFRRQGHARHMLRLLHFVLAPAYALPGFPSQEWGSPPSVPSDFGNAKFSVLYSDVGATFYASCGPIPGVPGWRVQSPIDMIWEVDQAMVEEPHELKWLRQEDLEAVLRKDAVLIRQEMALETAQSCSFTADCGLNNYLVQRAFLKGPSLAPNLPEFWGALVTHTEERPLAFITWTLDPETTSASLVITRLRSDRTTLPLLVGAARRLAMQRGLKDVVAWGVPLGLFDVGNSLGGRVEQRTDHLPSICVYGGDDKVNWLHNERFCWC